MAGMMVQVYRLPSTERASVKRSGVAEKKHAARCTYRFPRQASYAANSAWRETHCLQQAAAAAKLEAPHGRRETGPVRPPRTFRHQAANLLEVSRTTSPVPSRRRKVVVREHFAAACAAALRRRGLHCFLLQRARMAHGLCTLATRPLHPAHSLVSRQQAG